MFTMHWLHTIWIMLIAILIVEATERYLQRDLIEFFTEWLQK